MSPEQHVGEPCDARSDQYSFCLSLAEAIYGVRPPTDRPATEFRLPASTKVPARLRAALERGLSREREARFPSMEALLQVLEHDHHRGRRVRWLAIAAGCVVLGAFGFGYAVERGGREEVCEGADRKLAAVWNPIIAARLEGAFAATKQPDAALAWRRAREELDRYGRGWVAMRTEACEATRVHGDQSEELMDRRMACLGHRLEDFQATIDVLLHADGKVVLDAARIASADPPLAECSDATALEAIVRVPSDPVVRAKVDDVYSQLARVEATMEAGNYHSMLPELEAIVAAARATDYGPVIARAGRLLGSLQGGLGHWDPASTNLRAAYVTAVAAGDRLEAARIAAALIQYLGAIRERRDEGAWWADLARAELRGVGESGRDVAGRVEFAYADLMVHQARFDQAAAALDRVVAVWTATRGPESSSLLWVALTRGEAMRGQGKIVEALAAFRDLQRRAETVLGSSHPLVADVHSQMASTLDHLQRFREEIAEYRIAIAIMDRSTPPGLDMAALHQSLAGALARVRDDDEALSEYRAALTIEERLGDGEGMVAARAHSGIGTVFEYEGKYHEALEEHATALAILEKTVGPDAMETGHVYQNRASVLRELGRFDEALAELAKFRTIAIKALGHDHPEVAGASVAIAEVLEAKRQLPQALAELGPALTIFEAAIGPDAPYTAWVRISRARLQLRLHEQAEQALPAIDRGLTVLEGAGDGEHLAEAQFAIADALVDRDHARAVGLARRARGYFATRPKDPATIATLGQIDRWLAGHDRS
jgi:tetratricopeptide (TPR) repeat protein